MRAVMGAFSCCVSLTRSCQFYEASRAGVNGAPKFRVAHACVEQLCAEVISLMPRRRQSWH